jgi:hypothetical protein
MIPERQLELLKDYLDAIAGLLDDPKNRGRNGALKANPFSALRRLVAEARRTADGEAKTASPDR